MLAVVLVVTLSASGKERARDFYEPELLKYTSAEQTRKSPRLFGTVGSLDVLYQPDKKPEQPEITTWTATAWKGERVNGKFVVWSDTETKHTRLSVTALAAEDGHRIDSEHLKPHFQRYVLADGKPFADIIDTARYIDIPERTIRPIWLMIDVPSNTAAGIYDGKLTVQGNGGKEVLFDLKLTVVDRTLPPPSQWKFWLDLWISPWAIARYHQVELWSDEHFVMLKPYLKTAANMSQNCLHVSITDKTSGYQTYDPYDSLIKKTKNPDGSWTYDYSVFDRYVSLATECGLRGQINCDSMVTWGNNYYYYDGATGDYIGKKLKPGSPQYDEIWNPFLKDFARHLKEKGWFERAVIYFNERDPAETMKAVELVQKYAPGLNCALAGTNHKEYYTTMRDYSLIIRDVAKVSDEVRAQRLSLREVTTFYVCCNPKRPNCFTFSAPIESVWMGWFAAAKGLDGFLRWNFNMWSRDPFATTDYGTWPSGDTLLVYPGPRSSIRFERLREGIRDYEKIRILRKEWKRQGAAGQKKIAELEELLKFFQYPACGTPEEMVSTIYKGRALLN